MNNIDDVWKKVWRVFWIIVLLILGAYGWWTSVGCSGSGGGGGSTPQQRAFTACHCYLCTAKSHVLRDFQAIYNWVQQNKHLYACTGEIKKTFDKVNNDPDIALVEDWVSELPYWMVEDKITLYLDEGYWVSITYALDAKSQHTIVINKMKGPTGSIAIAYDLSTNGVQPYEFDLSKWHILRIEFSYFTNIGPLT